MSYKRLKYIDIALLENAAGIGKSIHGLCAHSSLTGVQVLELQQNTRFCKMSFTVVLRLL